MGVDPENNRIETVDNDHQHLNGHDNAINAQQEPWMTDMVIEVTQDIIEPEKGGGNSRKMENGRGYEKWQVLAYGITGTVAPGGILYAEKNYPVDK